MQAKKKYMPMWIWIIVWLFILGTLFNFVWPFLSQAKNPVFYVKADGLYVLPEGKEKSFKIADSIDENDVQQSPNGKKACFLDDNQNLYIRDIAENKENKFIDENVFSYTLINNNEIVYLKNEQMWLYDGKENKELDSNVNSFDVSNDTKKVIYIKNDGNYYIIGLQNGDAPEQYTIDSGANVISNKGEYKKFVFIEGNNVYLKEDGKEIVTIAENVDSAFVLGKSFYYFKGNDNEKVLYKLGKKGEEEVSNVIENELTSWSGKGIALLQSKNDEVYVLREGQVPYLTVNLQNVITRPQISNDGKNLYVLTNNGIENQSNLVKYKIGNDKLYGEKKVLENAEIYTYWLNNNKIFISTGTAEQQGLGVYKSGKYKEITKSGYLLGDLKNGIYYIDESGAETTLNKYYMGSVKKIDTQIVNYGFFGENLFYTKNQDLYWSKNDKSKKIDTGVEHFVFPSGLPQFPLSI